MFSFAHCPYYLNLIDRVIVIGFQKMYGLFGLDHQTLENVCDVTPVTNGRTQDRKLKIGQFSGLPVAA